MSTFDGFVKEFPDIRIDYFRARDSQKARPPLAYFLSHVHSDHLQGLETCKSPFIYCSPATREILLRLEKYPHRMNFNKGILESRKQTYRHLKNLLKPIPLETPTKIELAPGRHVTVTLFDANHCAGAVMFLIEGDGKSVIYTGDIRSEKWWVDTLCRSPVLLPYVYPRKPGGKQIRVLDAIYLDTTFAHKDDPYKHFPAKAEGLTELLEKVAKYPKGTLFYFDSWTFGYEDVWQALSVFLGSQIHVDDYRFGMYRALANGTEPRAPEAAKLMGFHCGNHFQQGCLTLQPAQIHSCEKGTGCDIWDRDFVRITPIISRHNGMDMAELGAGGGQGDLDQHHELDVGDPNLVGQLMELCATRLQGEPQLLASVMQLLSSIINDRVQTIQLNGSHLADEDAQGEEDVDLVDLEELPIDRLVPALTKLVTQSKVKTPLDKRRASNVVGRTDGLPKQIVWACWNSGLTILADMMPQTFPYSRHASYSELCELIEAFKPKDIHPCTVDYEGWKASHSMNFLFGHIYINPPSFTHDQEMLKRRGATAAESDRRKRKASSSPDRTAVDHIHNEETDDRGVLSVSDVRLAMRREAYEAALGDGMRWSGLISTTNGHQHKEEEL